MAQRILWGFGIGAIGASCPLYPLHPLRVEVFDLGVFALALAYPSVESVSALVSLVTLDILCG